MYDLVNSTLLDSHAPSLLVPFTSAVHTLAFVFVHDVSTLCGVLIIPLSFPFFFFPASLLKQITSYEYLKMMNFRFLMNANMAQTLCRKTKGCHHSNWSRTVGQGVENLGENHASAVVHLPQAFCSAKRGRRILWFVHSSPLSWIWVQIDARQIKFIIKPVTVQIGLWFLICWFVLGRKSN